MNWKARLRREFDGYGGSTWRSTESKWIAALREVRRFYAELIAMSVIEAIQEEWSGPPEELGADDWLEGFEFCDRMISWFTDDYRC